MEMHKKIQITLFCIGSNFTCIGPRRISAYLKSKGIRTRIVFVTGNSDYSISLEGDCKKQLADMLKKDIAVGISFTSNYLKIAEALTCFIKDALPIPVIWGGVHATVSPEESLGICDIACLGEGEEPLLEFIDSLVNLNKSNQIRNLWIKSGDQIIKNSQRPLMDNLDELPCQDYEIENHFILKKEKIRQLEISDLKKNFGFSLTRMMTFGCPFRCAYCANDRYQSLDMRYSQIRHYSVNYFINETKYILNKLPFISYLLFDDDAFLGLPQEVIQEFCEKYKKEIGLPFGIGGIKAEILKKEKLYMLVDAGLITVRMGIQSGSERVNRQVFKRHFSKEKNIEAAKIFKLFKNKLRPPFYDIILDNPWENRADKLATLELLRELPRPYFLNVFSLSFFPGTELYERALKEGLINAYDPLKQYHKIRKNFLNLLMLYTSILKFPRSFYRRFLDSKMIKEEKKEYVFFYYIYVFINLFSRLLSYYTNYKFVLAKIRKIGKEITYGISD
ncbi:MAG TPA: hypothetical protein DCY56_04830 [Candidatus Omnitrophica bacterium]|nr:hypothetical protein [Candidatus Omnitrophota bacterium]